MNRRDFTKGLATLPFIGAVKGFTSTCDKPCPSRSGSLRVILEGAFAVYIAQGSWRVRVFTPRHHGEHYFIFNHLPCDKDAKYKFELSQDGLIPASAAPCIDQAFQYFCAKTLYNSSTLRHFITIDLPGPQRIVSLSSGITATMEDNQQYSLPGDHVLEYDIKDPAKIKMSGWYNGHPLAKPLKYYEEGGYKNFGFQIGLPLLAGGDDSDPHGTHAVDFYNQALLPYFTNLKGSKRWRMRSVKGSYETTTLECKNGGLIGTMP